MPGGVALFGLAIFASAFLIFLVQPMVGKRILPWFGGSPGVWMLCLAFYQSALFLGYAYAHLLVRRTTPLRQPLVHALVFALAWAALPVLPGEAWRPDVDGSPSARILLLLAANVGLPFLMLASTGPLLQAWFARARPSRSPYPLYAVSNLGSLLALVSFPFLIEPRVPLPVVSRAWSWCFAALGPAVLACAWLAMRGGGADRDPAAAGEAVASGRESQPWLLWIALPAAAVVLLMGVTNKLCLDMASAPFLWVVPLALYLATFIACFGSRRIYRRDVFIPFAVACLLALLALTRWELAPDAWVAMAASPRWLIAIHSLVLVSGCMLVHGELYRLRPEPARLTAYYLCISGGGALGGLFVGIAAPELFSNYYELPLGLAVCWLLLLAAWWREPANHARPLLRAWTSAAVLGLAVLSAVALAPSAPREGVLLQLRNFFGTLRVREFSSEDELRHRYLLRSGTTQHGVQFRNPAARAEPTLYFGRFTAIGQAMEARPAGEPATVGVVGLGTGTLAAYGREGDRFVFYEIDPDVIEIAREGRWFTYLADSAAEIEIVPGDARLSLAAELREGEPRGFDLLVIDAFSSDAIPVHLLTAEAMRLYDGHLAPGGALAVHVSNRSLRLTPVVFRLGHHLGMQAVEITNLPVRTIYSQRSRWVFLSREGAYLESLVGRVHATRRAQGLKPATYRTRRPEREELAYAPLWTDDFSDLLRVLRPSRSFLQVERRDERSELERAP